MPSVVIDCFQESSFRYRRLAAIVVVDVFRATTTATTALASGRRVFPVRSTDEAFVIASTLENPILVGEVGGNMPYGFDLTNTPAGIAERTDVERPMVLLSSSGTELIMAAAGARALAISCFRNHTAVARWVIESGFEEIAVLGAGTRGQFRIEDHVPDLSNFPDQHPDLSTLAKVLVEVRCHHLFQVLCFPYIEDFTVPVKILVYARLPRQGFDNRLKLVVVFADLFQLIAGQVPLSLFFILFPLEKSVPSLCGNLHLGPRPAHQVHPG